MTRAKEADPIVAKCPKAWMPLVKRPRMAKSGFATMGSASLARVILVLLRT
uniref:hypothetical protein n=1 Tax=Ningiella ruwaisensis TaxID=2364274 RepID=UPI001446F303|nr:hypothetical protein [Ningiella ruwaisensis]